MQVHDAFDALLELLELQRQAPTPASTPGEVESAALGSETGAQSVDAFLDATCRQMLDVPYTRKGRWVVVLGLGY